MIFGKHADLMSTEDQPSRNIAAGEPWWKPLHRKPGNPLLQGYPDLERVLAQARP